MPWALRHSLPPTRLELDAIAGSFGEVASSSATRHERDLLLSRAPAAVEIPDGACHTGRMAVSWIPRIGDEFGAYQLEEMIGHGGMSIVYRARHLQLERSVALKLLAPELSDDPSFQERFVRESRLAASLDHPNVIPIYEAGEENGVFYIAMRYVPGSNLKVLLQRQGPLDPAHTVSIIGQIASALSAAHELGLVHRDVKPANVLMVEGAGPDGSHHVYLSDFGIARQQSASALTRTGMFVGTADYASPEQIEGKKLDARSDVYSLGCVLYECLTGTPAFDKDSEVALMYAHLLEPPPSVRATRPELPPPIDGVVAKAMAKDPEERYAAAKDLAAAARSALSQPTADGSLVAGSAPETVLAPGIPAAAAEYAAPPPVSNTAPQPAPSAPDVGNSPAAAEVGPPSPAAGHTAAPQAAERSRINRRSLAIVVGVLGICAAGAVLAVFLTGGGKGAAQQSAAPVSLLAALMPTGIASQCKTQKTPSYGAVQTELCHPPADAPTSFPQTFSFSFFRNDAALGRAYDEQKSSLAIGNCGATRGQSVWIHLSTGKTGGLRVCGNGANGESLIVWTHQKRRSFDHVDMLGVARASGRGSNLFRGWWSAVKDDVGKCRPLLPVDTCAATVQHFEKPK